MGSSGWILKTLRSRESYTRAPECCVDRNPAKCRVECLTCEHGSTLNLRVQRLFANKALNYILVSNFTLVNMELPLNLLSII